MHWVVFFIGAYFWNTAYSDWGWNGWVAFFFAVVCVGVILGIWETLFGKSMVDGGSSGDSSSNNEKGSSLTDTALKMGAGYGIAKLTGKKTYAYECTTCHHYEERSQHQKIGVKCSRCGRKTVQISKI